MGHGGDRAATIGALIQALRSALIACLKWMRVPIPGRSLYLLIGRVDRSSGEALADPGESLKAICDLGEPSLDITPGVR
jgi:hypothetical protein